MTGIEEFTQSRKRAWEALNSLVERGQSGLNRLTPGDVQTLGRLYRAATADLALAQRDFANLRVTAYLNQLVARAHALIYRPEPVGLDRFRDFFFKDFPRLFRRTFVFTRAAALLFLLPAILAGVSTAINPAAAYWLLPQDVHALIPKIEQQELWTNIPLAERPFVSSFIMRNNIQVAFLAFGSGMTAGVYTVWVLVMNGFILGGLTGLTAHYGIGFDLWTFVIGHGVIELSVICIAGGSGLMLGWGMLRPGLLRRRDALALAAQKAVRLLLGAVPWLIVAGLIEGFISPAESIPWPVKWGIGIGSGLVFYAYLYVSGREITADRAPSVPDIG